MKVNFTKKAILTGLATILVAAGAFVAVLSMTGGSTNAFSVGDRRDCGYDDVIVDCGATSISELLQVYDSNNDRRGNRDIQAIFHHYGIKRSDITGATSDVKRGWLNTNGTIVVDGKVVADGAQSLYRVHPGKQVTPKVIGGKTYYSGPVAGNYGLGADLFVFFNKDGTFRSAIQASCGNPIAATNKVTPPKPVYKCESLTAKAVNRTTYDFTVRASATNAKIVSYNFDFGNGRKATTANTTVRHDFGNNPGSYTVTVTVNVNVNGKIVTTPVGKCKTTVEVEELKPVFKCESLSATKLSRTQFRFNAAATAENATIRSYTFNFGDGNSETVTTSAKAASVTHTYSGEARSYTAQVTITMTDGKTATGPACKTTVKVEEKKVPSISIEKTVNGKKHDKVAVGVEFTYEITVRNTGNVVLKDAVVTDNAPSEVTLISASEGDIDGNTWTHTIPELEVEGVKSYTIKAKYDKYAEGVHKNRVCVDTPTVPGEPDDCDDATTETDEPIEVCDLTDNTIKTIQRSEFDEATMTTDLSECDEMEVCIIKDKTIKTIHRNEFDESTMTTDLSKCDEELPPELPQTGIDTLIGGSLGLGSITAAGYYWVASRRNLVSVLLNK